MRVWMKHVMDNQKSHTQSKNKRSNEDDHSQNGYDNYYRYHVIGFSKL